jgi:hypothetical protein
MKIFIDNYNLSNLKNKIQTLDKYLVNTTKTRECFSKYGHFYIDRSNVYRIIQNDKKVQIIEKYLDNLTFIIDYSTTSKEKENQIPSDSTILPLQNNYYSVVPNSKIKLVIQKNDYYGEIDLVDFYFEIKEEVDITNIFIKNELNVFLSLLN